VGTAASSLCGSLLAMDERSRVGRCSDVVRQFELSFGLYTGAVCGVGSMRLFGGMVWMSSTRMRHRLVIRFRRHVRCSFRRADRRFFARITWSWGVRWRPYRRLPVELHVEDNTPHDVVTMANIMGLEQEAQRCMEKANAFIRSSMESADRTMP